MREMLGFASAVAIIFAILMTLTRLVLVTCIVVDETARWAAKQIRGDYLKPRRRRG